ncbi:MAG: hypothetical protein J6C65_01860 [Prevotella sp.]|nr:hypothetical protein [Prevotella sp.]MBO5204763.1 hypothetical protein [Prevotella sp.]
MLIDDAKGTLSALEAKMQAANRVRHNTNIKVGDIVYQNMDQNDGLTLTKGYDTRLKYFVIVGKNSKGDAIGLCLINSNLDFYKDVPAIQRFQYILKVEDYPDILEKDSRLDCSQLFPMKIKKSIAVKAELVGHLTQEDEAKVLQLVASCGFIDEHKKRVYRIGEK